jgi:hypothetical protein
VLEEAPHGACIEQAEEFNRAVVEFIAAARETTAAR